MTSHKFKVGDKVAAWDGHHGRVIGTVKQIDELGRLVVEHMSVSSFTRIVVYPEQARLYEEKNNGN